MRKRRAREHDWFQQCNEGGKVLILIILSQESVVWKMMASRKLDRIACGKCSTGSSEV